jgi:hypothetical protein
LYSIDDTCCNNIIQELLRSLEGLEFSSGNASIDGVSKCSGEVSMHFFFCIKINCFCYWYVLESSLFNPETLQ